MAGDVEQLQQEHLASWRQYGAVQQRCSVVISVQHRRIEQLEAQLMRTRAALMLGVTAQAFAVEERAARQLRTAPTLAVDAESLEASLVAADLVICQTGCLSHGDYWRVQDHCRRTGKACVVVEQPDALRIVRLQRSLDVA